MSPGRSAAPSHASLHRPATGPLPACPAIHPGIRLPASNTFRRTSPTPSSAGKHSPDTRTRRTCSTAPVRPTGSRRSRMRRRTSRCSTTCCARRSAVRSGTCISCREARSTGCTSGRFQRPLARTTRAWQSRTSTTIRRICYGGAPKIGRGPGRRRGRTRCCTSLRPSPATWSRRSGLTLRSAASSVARSTSRGRKARTEA